MNLGTFHTTLHRTRVRFQFSTHAAAGGNVAPSSAFEAADIRIYRAASNGAISATQRSSSNGVTMTSPFDSLTGFHDVDIDLTDNTDAGFYAPGYTYSVVLAPDTETIDSQTITGTVLRTFEIGSHPSPLIVYVDKASGSDSNDGLTPQTAKSTIAGSVAGTYGGALTVARSAGGKTLIKCAPTGTYVERNVIDLLSTASGTPPIDLDITGCTVRSMASWNALTGGGSGIIFTAASVVAASGTATATFNTAGLSNYLKTGDTVVITGATPSGLNGSKTVTILNELQLTYSTAAADGAGTGTILFAITLAAAQIGSGITMATGSTVTAHNAVVYACPGQGTVSTYGSPGIYSNAIGCRGATHTSAKFYRVLGGKYIGDSDSFYDSSLWTPESPDGLEQKAYVEDAAFIAKADAFVVNAGSTHVIGRRLFISVYGPGTVDNFTTDSRALVGALGGRIDIYDSSILGQNATSKTYAVHAQGSNTSVNLYNTRLQTVSSSGTILDINTEDTSTVRVHDCEYDASKTASAGSSSIAVVPSHGADVRQAAGTNWNSGAIQTGTFAAGAINAAAIATDAIGANEFAQAAADKVWATVTRTITGGGGSTLTITPLVASVANPFYATRDLPKLPAASGNTIIWTITDGNGSAVDLSGKTCRLVAYLTTAAGDDVDSVIDDTIAESFQYETGGDGLTVGGADDNQITLVHSITKTATAGDYRYMLWNITDNTLLAKGKMPIEPSVKGS